MVTVVALAILMTSFVLYIRCARAHIDHTRQVNRPAQILLHHASPTIRLSSALLVPSSAAGRRRSFSFVMSSNEEATVMRKKRVVSTGCEMVHT